ncbi:MAG: RIP metalloprotease RseP [Candidatus Zhuqueibacterota bacterium]
MEAVIRLIIGLGILVFVHELGHFILAKLVGIRVERFSLGFPPRMVGKQIGETDYCISWVPLGGYVKMAGMIDESMDADSIKGEPWEFMSKPIYQRFLVIFAGPAMNILLAILIFGLITYFTGLRESVGVSVGEMNPRIAAATTMQPGDMILGINGQTVKTWSEVSSLTDMSEPINVTFERHKQELSATFHASLLDSMEQTLPPVVGSLQEDFPAVKAGMQIGDRIVAIDSDTVKTWSDMTDLIHSKPEQTLHITWERDGQLMAADMTTLKQTAQGKIIGLIGVAFPTKEIDISLAYALGHGARYSWQITKLIGYSIQMIITGEQKFKEAFAGPIMIAKLAKDSAREGESNFIAFIAFLSLNLGLLNLLPIPVLDGGHIVFLAIEAIIRRPISPKAKMVIQQVGMALLLAFMLFVIVNDIRRIL